MLSTISSSSICFKEMVAPWRFKNLEPLSIYCITWLVKTQKSTTKCSFVKIDVLRLTTDDIASKWTNHKFGPPDEYSYSIKDSFYLKMCFLNFFFQKVRGP